MLSGIGDELLASGAGREHSSQSAGSRRLLATVAVGFVIIAIAGFWMLGSSDSSGRATATAGDSERAFSPLPEVGAGGLPTLADVARVEAESTRQRATVNVLVTLAEFGDLGAVEDLVREQDPGLRWLDGASASITADEVSLAVVGPTEARLAIWAGDDRCALARIDAETVYDVTVETDAPCGAALVPVDAYSLTTP